MVEPRGGGGEDREGEGVGLSLRKSGRVAALREKFALVISGEDAKR